MKKKTLGCLCKWGWVALLFLVMSTANSFAQVPMAINYQGYLLDSEGYPIQGTEAITFGIYDAPVAGTLNWSETHSAVYVEAGVFSVILGQFTPLDTDVAISGTRYLGITVGSDSEMVPRQRLTSVPYALRAAVADSIEAGQLQGDLSVSGQVVVGTEDKNLALFTGGALVDLASTGSDLGINYMGQHHTLMNVAGGRVGIGTAAPGEKLSVAGTIESSSGGFKFPDGTTQASAGYTKAEVDAMVADFQNQIDQLKTLLAGVTRSGPNLIFSGVNVNIVNGLDSTATANGTGNLIVGYNEQRFPFYPDDPNDPNIRTGSHNVIIGQKHNYSSYGGLVLGFNNAILHHYASVTGGSDNIAGGQSSSVSGGRYNKASGDWSSVAGGGIYNKYDGNHAFGHYTAILGGSRNIAGDPELENNYIGQSATISGGRYNMASGWNSSVSGGWWNKADNQSSSVSGGYDNTASGSYSSVSGGLWNTASNMYSSVSGGDENTASGLYSSVSGGYGNTASGSNSSVSGGRYNQAIGTGSFVGGGGHDTNAIYGNRAYGRLSAILGGTNNETGAIETDLGFAATVSAGDTNTATGTFSTVSGGRENDSSGWYSSVSGGRDLDTSANDGWRAPGH